MDRDVYDQLDGYNASEIDAYMHNLNVDVIQTIRAYTHNLAQHINRAILAGTTIEESDDEIIDYGPDIETLDRVLSGVPPITRPVTLYRGVSGFPDIDVKTFMSTSYDVRKTDNFTGGRLRGKICCLLRITASAGSKILPIMDISYYPGEKEVLLARTGDFILTNAGYEPYDKIYGRSALRSQTIGHSDDNKKKPYIADEIFIYDLVYVPYKIHRSDKIDLQKEQSKLLNERIVQELVDHFHRIDPTLSFDERMQQLVRDAKANSFNIAPRNMVAIIDRISSTT
jgi:hypothetical protein